MHVHPAPGPSNVIGAWEAAVDDAGLHIGDVALMWRAGRARPTGQEASSWRPGRSIESEFADDDEFIAMLSWANSDDIRPLRRVAVWTDCAPEHLAGLLRHELEHTIQICAHVQLEHLHQRACEEIAKRGATTRSYNAIPMEVDANRAAARFLRRRYGVNRLKQLILAGDPGTPCFRPTTNPAPLHTLVGRMKAFIRNAMRDDDFVRQLEIARYPD